MARRKPQQREPTPAEEDGDIDAGQPLPDDLQQFEDPPPGEGEDARLRRAADGQRRTRAADSDPREDAGLATPRGNDLSFRDEFTQEALPKPPEIPGFHCCWLSTTNQWDPIPRRVRMGYVPVRPDEVPGFEYMTQKSGQWEGMIGINEMLLYKVPVDVWKRIMTEFHHNAPINEESGIRNSALAVAEELHDSDGKSLVRLEEGMETLGRQPRRKPGFSD